MSSISKRSGWTLILLMIVGGAASAGDLINLPAPNSGTPASPPRKATLLMPVEIAPNEMPPNPGAKDPASVMRPKGKRSPSRLTRVARERTTPDPGQDGGVVVDGNLCRPLSLSEAIEMAFQLQPRLRVYLERVAQAQGQADVAFSPFLPTVSGAYSVGGFNLDVGGQTLGGFAFLPPGATLPIGLTIQSSYELAELRLQWLICDFGRRLGKYRQAGLGIGIARLQADRAHQTIANEVAVAYYQVLRTQALHRTAQEAVRRSQDELSVARKLGKGGVLEREKILRAEVQLAEVQQLLDAAESAEAVAIAALNLAIGLSVSAPTAVVETSDVPPLPPPLPECLQTAVGQRHELDVARQTIRVAQEVAGVARADFAPRVVSEAALIDLQQASPQGRADLPIGFIKLEWGLFEGGRRVAEVRIADAKIRAAAAEAESVADLVSFQVTEAYHQLATARKGIDRAKPSVEQATENYRLVRARFDQGEATPTDIIEGETSLTRSQQNYLNSVYDYLAALARLEYAMGTDPSPVR